MFDEKDFKDAYKSAYDALTPNGDKVKQLKESCLEKEHTGSWCRIRPAVAVCGILLMLILPSTSAFAGIGNLAFEKISEIAPGLADYILPVKLADTNLGITMQVEAIHVNGKNAELLVSFADEEGSTQDLVSGKVDMYDSYNLKCYGSESNVGGCSFVEYDEEMDKAYFKVCVSSEKAFDWTKLNFTVNQLLVGNKEYEMQLNTDSLIMNPDLKECTLSGKGGTLKSFEDFFYKTEESFPRFATRVMDVMKPEEWMTDTIRMTGMGYGNGILRVQICRGSFGDAARHAQIYILKEDGTHRYSDTSVEWQEKLGEEMLSFNEQWFVLSEEELKEVQLYGMFYETDQSVNGKWSVTVNLAND